VPTLAMIRVSVQEMEKSAAEILSENPDALSFDERTLIWKSRMASHSPGGGSTPAQWLPHKSDSHQEPPFTSASQIEQRLRRGPGSTPVVCTDRG